MFLMSNKRQKPVCGNILQQKLWRRKKLNEIQSLQTSQQFTVHHSGVHRLFFQLDYSRLQTLTCAWEAFMPLPVNLSVSCHVSGNRKPVLSLWLNCFTEDVKHHQDSSQNRSRPTGWEKNWTERQRRQKAWSWNVFGEGCSSSASVTTVTRKSQGLPRNAAADRKWKWKLIP